MTILIEHLKQRGHLDALHFTLCNVGSRKLSIDDDYGSTWSVVAPNLTIYGFDADADACEAANQNLAERQINWTEKHIPLALSNAIGESTLYVTRHPMCSSLYPPNEPYLQRFAELSEAVNLDFMMELETTTLEAFFQSESVETIDFLQIDVQGADLQVLEGAGNLLDSVLAIQVEVEFSPLYQHQPLFADVDSFLRQRGFTMFDLAPAHRVRSCAPLHSHQHPGQLLWGEAYYFRDLIQAGTDPNHQRPERILTLACIADILGFPDYGLEILQYLTLHHHAVPTYNLADAIVASLATFPELVQQGLAALPIVANVQKYLSQDLSMFSQVNI